MPEAFGDASIPSLESFRPLIKRSDFSDVADQTMAALTEFQQCLNHDISFQKDLPKKQLRRYLQRFGLSSDENENTLKTAFPRDRYWFFFNVARTRDGGIALTVFLEAHPKEIQRRRKILTNANKHLHHAFLSADGIIQKEPGAFKRDQEIASTTEHTAYTKFYLKKYNINGKFSGISILMHPFQRARLAYDPSNISQYKKFGERCINLRGVLKKNAVGLERLKRAPETVSLLTKIADMVDVVRMQIKQSDAGVDSALRRLESMVRQIGRQQVLVIQSQKLLLRRNAEKEQQAEARTNRKPRQRHELLSLRGILFSFIADARQVRNMHQKRGRERSYSVADEISGINREKTLLAPSFMLKRAFELAFHKPAIRFMLSSDQIKKIRLKGEKGDIRERIMEIPRIFEQIGVLTVDDKYPLQQVDEKGTVSPESKPTAINLIQLDKMPSLVLGKRQDLRRIRKRERQNKRRNRNR